MLAQKALRKMHKGKPLVCRANPVNTTTKLMLQIAQYAKKTRITAEKEELRRALVVQQVGLR